MGNNTLVTKNIDDNNNDSDLNQFKEAIIEDYLPRNSAGVPANFAGSIGGDQLRFLKANIIKGYWNAGDIKPHHSYNGIAPIGNGWYPCDGSIINETNYDAIFGNGAWNKYVISSIFDGKYIPNLNSKYIGGTNTTTQDGTVAIPSTGNTSNQIDIEHSHTGLDHNHLWYVAGAGSPTYSAIVGQSVSGNEGTYDSGGNLIPIPASGVSQLTANCYTDNSNAGTDDAASQTQDIRPASIEVTFYMRII